MGGLIVRKVTSSIVCELCERCLNFTLPTALAITTITTIPDYTTSTMLYHTNETLHPLAPSTFTEFFRSTSLVFSLILPKITSHHILLLFTHTSKLTYGKYHGGDQDPGRGYQQRTLAICNFVWLRILKDAYAWVR